MDALEIIHHFYPDDTPLRRTLLAHSTRVRDKALEIMEKSGEKTDWQIVSAGAMLHDIGIIRCHAPAIFCPGGEPYIAHGIIGAGMLRRYAAEHGIDLESCARICERHTGSGITAQEVRDQSLPLPVRDYLPETVEEQLVCLADKFFSKSGNMQEKSLDRIRNSMFKFGPEPLARFDALCRRFGVK